MDQNALEEYQKQESFRSKEKTARLTEERMKFIGILSNITKFIEK